MSDKIIPKEILQYFEEIAERLWSGHASVMVGAGFSRNASKDFPTWNQLGDAFYKKAYGGLPNNNSYLNILKLAEEVEATFGRPALDQILIEEIPDKNFQPSKLHEELLKLPWVDIFTTNYDTLLERACENVPLKKYDIVTSKDDLVYSSKPRIIKLHGSFPSERPFIITEEDYRNYPVKFAPFVNTVQQSLIENTLCLIGFSGDDPNFLKWIGWIHDNLGKDNSPKIYLIGVLNLSVAQIKLLEKRNITLIDLSCCKDVDGDFEKAFSVFLDYLNNKRKTYNKLGWPLIKKHFFYDRDKDITPQILPILDYFTILKSEYPGWIIVPESEREILESFVSDANTFIYHLSKIKTYDDLPFLYEYNWLIEKCLLPISNELIKIYEQILDKYNPFPDLIEIEGSITPKTVESIDWSEFRQEWIELQLSLFRLYREEGFHSQWQIVDSRLNQISDNLIPELRARYHYERCLKSFFSYNIAEIKNDLKAWPVNNTLPFWEAKRAGLIAELGDISKAEKIIENSLITIRRKLNLKPILNDYSYVSQEAYVMLLLKFIKHSASIANRNGFLDKLDTDSFINRWDELVQFKCDPWAELKYFKTVLDREPVFSTSQEKKYSFDIGQISTTYRLGNYNKFAVNAYSYLRFVEEIGIPYRLPWMTISKETAEGAVKQIAVYSPYWATATLIRIGDLKLSDSIFDRKTLSNMNQERTDSLINEYRYVLEKSKLEIKNSDPLQRNNFASSLASVIPEVLSRLCVKSSYEIKLKLISSLKEIYSSDFLDKYRGIGNLTKRLINSLSEFDQYRLIPIFLDFPVLPELNHLIDSEYQDPFSYIEINKESISRIPKFRVNPEKIKELLDYSEKSKREKQNALRRLIILWDLDLLSSKQVNQLAKSLWKDIDNETGFPANLNYYFYSYLNFPHPLKIDPAQLFKVYISKLDFPIHSDNKGHGLPITNGVLTIAIEILGASSVKVNYKWDKIEINLLANKLIKWWDNDKKYLLINDKSDGIGSFSKEFKARFRKLISIFSIVLSPNFHLLDEHEKNEVLRILDEFEHYDLLTLEVNASFYQLIPDQKEKTFSNIYDTLFSKDEEKVKNALNAFQTFLRFSEEKTDILFDIIIQHIKARSGTALTSFIKVASNVLKKYPRFMNRSIQYNLKFALSFLTSEVQIQSDDSPENVDIKLSLKEAIADLTLEISYYLESKKLKIPEYIDNWKSICLDKNEFSEIRRIWENKINICNN